MSGSAVLPLAWLLLAAAPPTDSAPKIASAVAGLVSEGEPGLAVLNAVVLNQVALACGEGAEGDRFTRATLAQVQADGICYPTHGRWRGREIIRVSVSAGPTTIADGTRSAEAIIAAWRRVQAAG